MSPGIKAISVDIDGTLTDDSGRVSCRAIEVLRHEAERGITVMLVTGNVLPIAYALSYYLGFNGPVIAENGGVVSRGFEVKKLGSKEEPMRAYEHLCEHMTAERIFSDKWRETEVAIKPEYDLHQVREYMRSFNVKVVTTGWAYHIMNRDTDKAVGLRYVCDNWLKIGLDEVAAIGDSDNDANMIKCSGYGITLANGSEICKENADFIASRPNGDGIIEAVEWLGSRR